MLPNELMTRRFLPLTAAALLVLSACGGEKTNASSTPPAAAVGADSGATMAMRDSAATVEVIPPAATPAPTPTPTPASVTPRPTAPVRAPKPSAPGARSASATAKPSGKSASNTAAPAAPARGSGAIASGTSIATVNGPKVCSNTLQVGDRVTVTTSGATGGSNGVSIPAGARVGLVVTKSRTSTRAGEEAVLAFDVRSITFGDETYTVVGDVSTDAIVTERKGGDGKKVAIGAAAGAVIGNIIGGGSRAQRTVVGAAAGGAAGAVAAAVTGDRFACLPEGASLSVRLGSALTVRN